MMVAIAEDADEYENAPPTCGITMLSETAGPYQHLANGGAARGASGRGRRNPARPVPHAGYGCPAASPSRCASSTRLAWAADGRRAGSGHSIATSSDCTPSPLGLAERLGNVFVTHSSNAWPSMPSVAFRYNSTASAADSGPASIFAIHALAFMGPGQRPASEIASITPREKTSPEAAQAPRKTSGAQKPMLPLPMPDLSPVSCAKDPKSTSFSAPSRKS
mmetsp:Transcript_62200/g.180371  ORF Transcript_62200/g.180371 Transcript_62200/m.180371 type:complete len:220 (+) Transcript_62200:149-808(+)